MKRSEYEAKLNKYEEEIEELKKCIKELKNEEIEEDEVCKPEYGEDYWFINSFGRIVKDEWIYFDGDELRYNVGNVYKTKEEAEFEAEKLKVVAELKNFSCKFRKGELNYYISLNTNTNELGTTLSDIYMRFDFYFESYEKANEAIEEVGEDRIKKYLFEVEE